MQYAVSHALMGPHLNKLRGMQDSLDSPNFPNHVTRELQTWI